MSNDALDISCQSHPRSQPVVLVVARHVAVRESRPSFFRFVRMKCLRIIALLALASPQHLLGAQAPGEITEFPPPDVADAQRLPSLGSDLLFTSTWMRGARSGNREPYRVPPVSWLANHPIALTVSTPWRRADIVRRRDLAVRLATCFSAPASEALRTVRSPWAELDAAVDGRAFVLLQLDAAVGPPPSCSAAHDPDIRSAGLQVLAGSTPILPRHDLVAAAIVMRDSRLVPALAARAGATIIGPDGTQIDGTIGSLRLFLTPDALAPDARGQFSSLNLLVRSADPARQEPVILPDSIVAALWHEFTGWRLARLEGAEPPAALPRLRAPADSALSVAHTMYGRGEALAAATIAERWLEERADERNGAPRARAARERSTTSDRDFAHLLVGSVFLGYGDTVASREPYAAVLREHPCLRFSRHPAFDRVIEGMRDPEARCTGVSKMRQAMWGAMVPGGGQWVRGQRRLGTFISGASGALLASALRHHLLAARQFDEYRSAPGPDAVDALLDRANRTRGAVRRDLAAAASIWVASAVAGFIAESWHRRRIAAEQQYESNDRSAERAR